MEKQAVNNGELYKQLKGTNAFGELVFSLQPVHGEVGYSRLERECPNLGAFLKEYTADLGDKEAEGLDPEEEAREAEEAEREEEMERQAEESDCLAAKNSENASKGREQIFPPGLLTGEYNKHESEDIVFMFRLPTERASAKTLRPKGKEAKTGGEKASKKTKSNGITTNETTKRPMPSYLVTRITSEFLSESTTKDVWQLKQQDPLYKYKELSSLQQRKVEAMFQTIINADPEDIVQFRNHSDDDIGFNIEGGKSCGDYGTKGLSELTYILEIIAFRLSKDTDLVEIDGEFVKRPILSRDPFTHSEIWHHVLSPQDLINGKIAFLEFVG